MDSGGNVAWLLWLDPGACQAGWEDICKGLSIGVTLTMNIGLSQTAQAPHLALRQEDSEQKASKCDWNIGNKERVMPGRG